MSKPKKLLLAAGGTGGHLFPAQAVAVELINQMPDVELVFAGAGLKTNRYFDRKKFSFRHISSTTIFQRNLINLVRCPFLILKGLTQGLRLMRSFKPDLVIGFGSFHTMPVLLAAKLCRVPIALFEANAYPGRVNRLFSRWAKWVAIYFPDASSHLKARTYLIKMPFWRGMLEKTETVTRAQSLSYLGLKQQKKTILIFGGSQGAASINQIVAGAVAELSIDKSHVQIVHITGSNEASAELTSIYSRLGINAAVKEFEKHMHLVWPCVDIAISRAGAGSIAEQINYEVPSILIPYPHAANNHQVRNGKFMADTVRGATVLKEPDADATKLCDILHMLLHSKSNYLETMKESISEYKKITKRISLTELVKDELMRNG